MKSERTLVDASQKVENYCLSGGAQVMCLVIQAEGNSKCWSTLNGVPILKKGSEAIVRHGEKIRYQRRKIPGFCECSIVDCCYCLPAVKKSTEVSEAMIVQSVT